MVTGHESLVSGVDLPPASSWPRPPYHRSPGRRDLSRLWSKSPGIRKKAAWHVEQQLLTKLKDKQFESEKRKSTMTCFLLNFIQSTVLSPCRPIFLPGANFKCPDLEKRKRKWLLEHLVLITEASKSFRSSKSIRI